MWLGTSFAFWCQSKTRDTAEGDCCAGCQRKAKTNMLVAPVSAKGMAEETSEADPDTDVLSGG